MSFSNEPFWIAAFPSDSMPWRIDWFGEVAFFDQSVRRMQPSVTVYLSQVTTRPGRNPPANLQCRVQVSVGTLPLLRIGDIWRSGQLEDRPDYKIEEFADIQIDTKTTTLIKAGLNLNENGFLLPLQEHPGHRRCTQSYCLMVQLPKGPRLIVPCMELIRFYFGSSNGLVTKLFLPPLARNALYEHATFDSRSTRLFLTLSEKMSGASAADIGRIHMDPIAWRAAARIGTSMLKSSVASQTIYSQTFFPFEGITTLVAAGKWLSFADKPDATFLVYNLRSCSHPFPFNSLRYEIKGIGAKQRDGGAGGHRPGASDANNQPIVELDPSNSLVSRTRTYHAEQRFPDLTKKFIWKSKTLSLGDRAVRRSGAPDVETAAIGEPGSERRTRPLDIALLTSPEFWENETIPEFLRDVLYQMRFLETVSIELLTESVVDGWTVLLMTLNEEIDSSLLKRAANKSLDLRKASVFAFTKGVEQMCAVVVESEPVHMMLYSTTGQDSVHVWKTLRCAPKDFQDRNDQTGPVTGLSIDTSFSRLKQWSNGAMEQWSNGAMEQWSNLVVNSIL